jgi:cytoskeleton protein RodZ
MSDEELVFSGAIGTPKATTPQTAGTLLKAARERSGLHIAALAVSMKVPVKKLEALEADRLDLLPDAVFVRALAASVCRTLKIEAAPVLDLLPSTLAPKLNPDDRGLNTPFETPAQSRNLTLGSLFSSPSALWVVVLLLGAFFISFIPEPLKNLGIGDKTLNGVSVVSPDGISPSLKDGKAPDILMSTVNPAVPASSTEQNNASQNPATTNASTSVANAATDPIPNLTNLELTSGAALKPQAKLLQFVAKGVAWVQVTDAKGIYLLSRTLQAGEVVGVEGNLPLSVIVGRADLTSVELHGKPYDLSSIAQNNVARFEVK